MFYYYLGLATGMLIGLVIAVIITRIAYLRLVRAQRRAQMNERLAELGTLTGGLAHEIKNPLSTIQLNLQLLLEDIHPDDPLHGKFSNRISTVQREAGRLRDILDDFLRFAGKITLQPQQVDLNELLQDLVDFFSPQAQSQRIELRLRRSPRPVLAEVDPRLIKQAILNLMLNGMQAMNPGGGELILNLTADAHHAVIDVIDTGKGMPPDVQQKIFQAYYSLRKGGTGLGLAMARRIADEHGGKISVRSEEGKGTDFTVTLPLHHTPHKS